MLMLINPIPAKATKARPGLQSWWVWAGPLSSQREPYIHVSEYLPERGVCTQCAYAPAELIRMRIDHLKIPLWNLKPLSSRSEISRHLSAWYSRCPIS